MKDDVKSYPKIQCNNCKDIIQSQYSGDWVACKCFKDEEGNKGCYIDSTDWYTRVGGGPFTDILEADG